MTDKSESPLTVPPTLQDALQEVIKKLNATLLETLKEKAKEDDSTEENEAKKTPKWVTYFKHLTELQQKEECRAAMPWLEKLYNPPLWDLTSEKEAPKKAGEWFRNTLISVLEKDPALYNTSAIQGAIAKNEKAKLARETAELAREAAELAKRVAAMPGDTAKTAAEAASAAMDTAKKAMDAAKKAEATAEEIAGKEKGTAWSLDNKRHLSLPLPLAALSPTIKLNKVTYQSQWLYGWRSLDEETGIFLNDAVNLTEGLKLTYMPLKEQQKDNAVLWSALIDSMFDTNSKPSAYLETMMDWRKVADFLDSHYPDRDASAEKAIAYAKISRLKTHFNSLNVIYILMETKRLLADARGRKCLYLREKDKDLQPLSAEGTKAHLLPLTKPRAKPASRLQKVVLGEKVGEGSTPPNLYPLWDFSLFPKLAPTFHLALDYASDRREATVKEYLTYCSAKQLCSLIDNILSPTDNSFIIPGLGCRLRRCDLSNPDNPRNPNTTENPRGTNSGFSSKNHGRSWDSFLNDLFAKTTGKKKTTSEEKTTGKKKTTGEENNSDPTEERKVFFNKLRQLAKAVEEEEQHQSTSSKDPKKDQDNSESPSLRPSLEGYLHKLICTIAPVYLSYCSACGVSIWSDDAQNDTLNQDLNTIRAGRDELTKALQQDSAPYKKLSNMLSVYFGQALSVEFISDFVTLAACCQNPKFEGSLETILAGASNRFSTNYGITLEPVALAKCLTAFNEANSAPIAAQLALTTTDNEVQ